MSKITDIIFNTILNRTIDVLLRNDVPIKNDNAILVAEKVTKEIAPVVINSQNAEPWYRSRIYLGLIAAGVGAIAQHFGINVSGSDIQLFTNSIPELIQAGGSIAEILGLLYAAYGRIMGSRLKPLGVK